ncbi:flagellar motor switch protein FliG [Xinfangfangia sp. D13-10-4-6]|uniref:flagellar motor switch protein FliG n=1 Tax=Pseudogemmobacter hezensis TaxID=2737662 RepID=UPI0015520AB9|nr:FliG C-terminal domain-containing protein [Pseudogemmobacter hezensis]NPD15334.1 flagellar motor switch protein FliG [Pseudogemmobacter hezensis]
MTQGLPLARINPAQRSMTPGLAFGNYGAGSTRRMLNAREKAAVVVRYLLAQGAELPIAQLPDHLQTALAEQMGQMRLVDRETLDQVVSEFMSELDSVGLAFPGGLEGALNAMDGHISQTTASRLRRKVGVGSRGDPWDRLASLSPERLVPLLENEAAEVAAVILSKMPVQKAAEFLGKLPGERARRIAFAVSQTANTDPETVRRIGIAVLGQIDAQPLKAFDRGPVERVGAILNIAPAQVREDVLKGLEDEDAGFAEEVRRSIFTFAHFPARVSGRDIPKVARLIDQATLVTAVAYSRGKPALEAASEFILACISQRMAQNIREEVEQAAKVKDRDGEAAMAEIVGAARTLESQGELVMMMPEDTE